MIMSGLVSLVSGFIVYKIIKAKKKIKRKTELLKEESYYTYTFVEDILRTTVDDWEYNEYKEEMIRTICGKNEDIQIEQMFDKDWRLGEINQLSLRYDGNELLKIEHNIERNRLNTYSHHPGILQGEVTKEQKKMLKKVIKHLRFIEKQHEMKKEEEEKRAEKEEKEKKERRMERKMNELDFLLENEKFENRYRRKGTTEVEVQIHGHYYALTVMMEGKLYAEYIYSKENRQFDTRYYNTNDENYYIVFDREVELKDYLEGVSVFHPSETLKDTRKLEVSLEIIEKKYEDIQTKIKCIQKEKEWLKEESVHLLNQTIPFDLEKLMNMYEKVKNKEDIEGDMMESFEMIEERLIELESEIESEKVREIRHRKEVIKLR